MTELNRLFIRGGYVKSLPEGFERLVNLTELDISANEFSEFPRSICSLSRLQHLDISQNAISALPDELYGLRSLEYLNVEKNNPLVDPAGPLPPVLTKLHWVTVRGMSLDLRSSIDPRPPKLAKEFREEVDEDDLEMFIRSRASSRITAKLRRRKKNKSSGGAPSPSFATAAAAAVAPAFTANQSSAVALAFPVNAAAEKSSSSKPQHL